MKIKLTSKEQLEILLETGKYVTVWNERNNNYEIFSPSRDYKDSWRTSDDYKTIEECKKDLGSSTGYNNLQNFINNNDLYIVEVFSLLPEKEMTGKVMVMENAEEMCNKMGFSWEEDKEDMIGKVYEVKFSDFNRVVINNCNFPIEAVMPVIEEEPKMTVDEMIEYLRKAGKIKQGDIIN